MLASGRMIGCAVCVCVEEYNEEWNYFTSVSWKISNLGAATLEARNVLTSTDQCRIVQVQQYGLILHLVVLRNEFIGIVVEISRKPQKSRKCFFLGPEKVSSIFRVRKGRRKRHSMDAQSYYQQGCSLFVDEDYESALGAFNKAIAQDGSSEGAQEYYIKRSACLHKVLIFPLLLFVQ